jgi:hypothetical protein
MHFYAVEIYVGKINVICETESSFLFSNIKIDARDVWYASNSKSWVLRSRTLETGYSVVEGRACQEDGMPAWGRPENGRMDRQTVKSLISINQQIHLSIFFLRINSLLNYSVTLLESYLTGTWISVFLRARHCYFLSWDRSVYLRLHFFVSSTHMFTPRFSN